MANYKLINNVTGWIIFVIATAVYSMTMEDTVSFWDCGEFISGAYKLQVVHPPGAPFFLLVGRLFTMFVSPEHVAESINFLSALSTGLCVLFMFWSVTALAKKLVHRYEGAIELGDTVAVMGAGVVGALACTFADTMWFSAVEGEVYAMSSFLTAFVFWAILKWEANADEPNADRYILLIAAVTGMSIGVHLLNLLTIPAVALVYYFKRYKATPKGTIITILIGGVMLGIVQSVIIPRTTWVAAGLDRMLVNGFGMPFWSGAVLLMILLVVGFIAIVMWAQKNKKYFVYLGVHALAFIMVGYFSYAMVVIRSNADTSIDMSNPADLHNLLSYLNREQYGEMPILFGPYFTSKVVKQEEGDMKWFKGEEKYEEIGARPVYKFDKEYFFPRIHDWRDNKHIKFYKTFLGMRENEKPKFSHNLRFFFGYQINFMYWRYFLWNFSGRQNEIQGHRGKLKGNWLSGIPFIDDTRLAANQAEAPHNWNNKAFNQYYLLPFLLGVIGLLYQIQKSRKDFVVVFMLFFMTGIAIVLFLNQTPQQPRERDYAYAGSIYAYCIWIGLGVLGIIDMMRKNFKELMPYIIGMAGIIVFLALTGFADYNPATFGTMLVYSMIVLGVCLGVGLAVGSAVKDKAMQAGMATLICLIVPYLMGSQNWDDHDRSDTYTARDFAINYLESCAPNSILFTQGDNDTYPLWYAQEVEGIRTDVRIVNLSLGGVDWYIDQLHSAQNEAAPVDLTLSKKQYRGTTRDYTPYYNRTQEEQNDRYYDVAGVVKFMGSDDKAKKVMTSSRELVNYLPTRNLRINVDSNQVLNNGYVSDKFKHLVKGHVKWNIGNKNGLYKNDLLTLDILSNFNWERPIYWAISVNPKAYLGLQEYFQLEGLTYRLMPYKTRTRDGQPGRVHTEIMYDNLMNKFVFGGIGEGKDLYLNENNLRMTMNLRNNYARMAEELIREKKIDKAKEALDYCVERMPNDNVPFNIFALRYVDLYYKVDDQEKARWMIDQIAGNYDRDMEFYSDLDEDYFEAYSTDIQQTVAVYQDLVRMAKANNDKEKLEELNPRFEEAKSLFGILSR